MKTVSTFPDLWNWATNFAHEDPVTFYFLVVAALLALVIVSPRRAD